MFFLFLLQTILLIIIIINLGPYGEQDDEQVFIQKVVPETDQLYVRYASTGKRYF